MAPKLVPLGTAPNAPLIPQMGFGLMGLSPGHYGAVPADPERLALLDRALALGCTFWDTSDLYSDSEALLRKWFTRTGKRDQIFLATKFGYVQGSRPLTINSSAEYARDACEKSLRVLGVDHIDLYYAHSVDTEVPVEVTMRALKGLQEEGKIRHIGLSSVSSATVRRAMKIARVAAVQVDYSPVTLEIEGPSGTDLLKTCRELGIAVVAAMPLGRGLVTTNFSATASSGDGTDMRAKFMPRFNEANRQRNAETVGAFAELAGRFGCTVPQLALAWLMKQGEDVVPIPGTKNVKYLEENWGACNMILSDEDEREIRKVFESAEVVGDVVPSAMRKYLYRDTVEES